MPTPDQLGHPTRSGTGSAHNYNCHRGDSCRDASEYLCRMSNRVIDPLHEWMPQEHIGRASNPHGVSRQPNTIRHPYRASIPSIRYATPRARNQNVGRHPNDIARDLATRLDKLFPLIIPSKLEQSNIAYSVFLHPRLYVKAINNQMCTMGNWRPCKIGQRTCTWGELQSKLVCLHEKKPTQRCRR